MSILLDKIEEKMFREKNEITKSIKILIFSYDHNLCFK